MALMRGTVVTDTHVALQTQTPPLVFTPEILYMMSNISSLVNVDWFLGWFPAANAASKRDKY